MLPTELAEVTKSLEGDGSGGNIVEERADSTEDEAISDQVPTLAIHEKNPMGSHSNKHVGGDEAATNSKEHMHESSHLAEQDKILINGELESSELKTKGGVLKKLEEIGNTVHDEHDSFAFGGKSQHYTSLKV